jgi:hypothetical protein
MVMKQTKTFDKEAQKIFVKEVRKFYLSFERLFKNNRQAERRKYDLRVDN